MQAFAPVERLRKMTFRLKVKVGRLSHVQKPSESSVIDILITNDNGDDDIKNTVSQCATFASKRQCSNVFPVSEK